MPQVWRVLGNKEDGGDMSDFLNGFTAFWIGFAEVIQGPWDWEAIGFVTAMVLFAVIWVFSLWWLVEKIWKWGNNE